MYLDNNYIPKVTTAIIIVNVVVFVILEILGDTESASFMAAHGALSVSAVEAGQVYVLFTSMFLHFGFVHLVNNMFVLFFVGRYLEQEVGAGPFLIIYLFGGLFGNVISLIGQYHSDQTIVSAGASGAIFAVVGALFLLVLLKEGRLASMSKQGVIMMVVLSVYQGCTTVGVNNTAHIAGLCGGVLLGGLYHIFKIKEKERG